MFIPLLNDIRKAAKTPFPSSEQWRINDVPFTASGVTAEAENEVVVNDQLLAQVRRNLRSDVKTSKTQALKALSVKAK
jgi:hypothetical protein